MKAYDEEEDEDGALDSLMGAMEGLDAKQFTTMKAPNSGTTVEVHIHPQGMAGEAPIEEGKLDEGMSDENMLPTPEELEEMMKGLA